MRKWNKLLALLLAMVMALGMTATALAEEEEEPAPPFEITEDVGGAVVILHTNDVHGAVEGYARAAALKAMYEEAGATVYLMDAGDFSQGETYVSVSQGSAAVELMNLAGYVAAAPGNHEFDYGYENLVKLAEEAEFPILAANVTYGEELAFEDNITLETADGVKLGVFGLDTPETASKAHPGKIKGVTFASGEALYAAAQAQVDELTEAGCDYIICLGHLGIDDETAATANRSIDLLGKVTGIDVFIDGHSHSSLEQVLEATDGSGKVGETYLTSTGTKLASVGVVTIKDGEITVSNVAAETITVPEDSEVAARAAEIIAEIEEAYGATFATSDVTLNGERDPGNRTEETNLGDLIADAMLWYATKDGEDLGVPAENVIALTNGGGIRASIEAGDISRNAVNTVLPFGNTVAYVTVTGEALLEVLEASTFCTPTAVGAFPQVAGINFTVDTSKPFDQGEAYGDTTYFAPNSINRVTISEINGQAFDSEASYVVVTNDFLASGGDTYFAFTTSASVVDTGMALDEALMAYITEVLEGKVTSSYAEPAGRITILAPEGYTDVTSDRWFFGAVSYVLENELMDGLTETTFGPGEDMTRAVLVEALYRLAGSPDVAAENPFSDVADDASYKNAVIWASENDIVGGYTDGTFKPEDSVQRQQIAAILYRYVGSPAVENADLSAYADADSIQSYAADAMNWAIANGLIKGDNNGNLTPRDTATRAQVATILQAFAPLAGERGEDETPADNGENSAPFLIETKIRLAGDTEWSTEPIEVKVGDQLEIQTQYKNLSGEERHDVMITAVLPENLEYVAGSTMLWNSNHEDGASLDADTVSTTGVNIGHYMDGANAYVRFTVTVVDNGLQDGSNTLVVCVQGAAGEETMQDDASVVLQYTAEEEAA